LLWSVAGSHGARNRDSSPNAVIVFLPQAPTPMSRNIMYLPEEGVRPLPITMVEAMSIVKRMGIGSSRALHAIDLGCRRVPRFQMIVWRIFAETHSLTITVPTMTRRISETCVQ